MRKAIKEISDNILNEARTTFPLNMWEEAVETYEKKHGVTFTSEDKNVIIVEVKYILHRVGWFHKNIVSM